MNCPQSIIKVGKAPAATDRRSLPAFYEDFEGRRRGDKEYRSASRDVLRLLDDLRKERWMVWWWTCATTAAAPLRAVELTGLFIDRAGVVQRPDRLSASRVTIMPASPGVMAVLINRGSASASEIFRPLRSGTTGGRPSSANKSFGEGHQM